MKQDHKCWDFIMSSFARTYGVHRVMSEQKFHTFALEWCDDHNYECLIDSDLTKVDRHLKDQYENWVE